MKKEVNKYFDIERHKYIGCETEGEYYDVWGMDEYEKYIKRDAKRYMELMIKERYLYTIEDLVRILDLKRQYIQINLIRDKKLDTLYIVKPCKDEMKRMLKHIGVITDEEFELINEFAGSIGDGKLKLLDRIFISESSVKELIGDLFKRVIREDGEEKIIDINEEDVERILAEGVSSTTKLKTDLDFKHNMQLYRFLEKTPHIKYIVVGDWGDRNNLARYQLYNSIKLKRSESSDEEK